MNSISIGITAISAPAISNGYSTPARLESEARPTGSVSFGGGIDDQRPHQVVPAPQAVDDDAGDNARPDQRQHDAPEDGEVAVAVDQGRFFHFLRHRQNWRSRKVA